jgi:hypothetical protein
MIGTHETLVYANRSAPTGTAVDVTCLVDDVSLVHGRDDASSQPTASSATLNVTVSPTAPLPAAVDIGAWLVVTTVLDGERFTRFTGRVTDMAIGWDDAGENTPEAGFGQIVAIGVLADYGRRIIGEAPFPQELDGARVARVFAAAGLALNPATSDPGVVAINPRDVDASNALEVAQAAAEDGGGIVWETRAGDVRYADAEHRRNAIVDLDLDACDLYVSPTWARNLGGLVNEITLGYGVKPDDGDLPTIVAADAASAAAYGRYEYSVTTEIATQADAQKRALLILTRNRAPSWQLNALPVAVPELDVAQTRALLGLDVHGLVRVTGLPATGSTPTSFAAWVEGWTERLAWGVHELELTVTDYCRTSPPPRWNDLDPALTWDQTPGTWNDATCLGPQPNRGRWDDVPATTRWDMVDPALTWDTWKG